MSDRKVGVDLTEGSISKNLIKLAIPIFMGNLLYATYNIADTIWIGQIVGKIGLSATAVTFPISMILIGIATGITMTGNVLIGQCYGAKDTKSMIHVSRVATTVATIVSLILVSLLYIFLENILLLLNTPPEVYSSALSYCRIIILGFPFLFYYFLIASFLYGTGDTVRPLIFLSIAIVLNIILDPLLIMGIAPFPKLGLEGAAIATVFSQFVSVIISVIYLKLKRSDLRVNPFRLVYDLNIIKKMFIIGLPTMTTRLIGLLSFTFIIRLINSFGTSASASIGIMTKLDIPFVLIVALSTAITTMTAQNIGAGRIDRIKDIHKVGVKISVIMSLLFAIIVIIFAEPIAKIFTSDAEVIRYTRDYIRIVMPSLIPASIAFSTNGVINGAGKTIVIAVFAFVSLMMVRVPIAYILVDYIGIFGVYIAMSFDAFASMILSLLYYYSGKWKKNPNNIDFNNNDM